MSSSPSDVIPASAAGCGTASSPQLNPEALNNINAPAAWSSGATGQGVLVATIADGTDTTNPDLQRNSLYASGGSPAGSPVVTNYQDFSGDGTVAAGAGVEAMGDASSIAAQGNTTYDLSTVVNPAHPLPAGCDIKVVGVAPGASVMALDVFSNNGFTTGSNFIQAINYAVANGAKVINESFGGNPFPDGSVDIVRAADDAAVAAGVTVVVSTGDAGISSTIGSPSTDPNVIAVGASTTFRSYEQQTFGGVNWPGASGGYIDNNIASLASGGFAQNGKTADLVAPGDLGWALSGHSGLDNFGGTSQSAPLTSGAVADVIQAYMSTHSGASPSPSIVKEILTSSATDVRAPADQQGAGLLNVGQAVTLAKTINLHPTSGTPGTIFAATTQLNLTGFANGPVVGGFRVTNESASASVVHLSTRQLKVASAQSGTVILDPSTGTLQPNFIIWSGVPETYTTSTFTVPSGTDRVKFTSDYAYTGQSSLLHVALFDPSGNYAGYSLPQGLGNFADVEVADPAPGTWTAVYFTLWNGAHIGHGTRGPIDWNAAMEQYSSGGLVFPSVLTLGPGASSGVLFAAQLPSNPGDSSQSIVISSGSQTTTVPVTMRTAISLFGFKGGTFTGTLTGGNGRAGAPAQSNTYLFNVPWGAHDVTASVALASNPSAGFLSGAQFVGELIDPNGQIVAYDTNLSICGSSPCVTNGFSLFKANPVPGFYELLLDWANPVSGAAVSTPFVGAVRFNQVTTSNNLPNSAGSTVSTSGGGSFTVNVTNTGVAALSLYTEARLPVQTTFDEGAAPITTPGGGYFIYSPTQTSSISASVSASVPVTFDLSTYTGDPDISPAVPEPFVSSTVTPTSSALTYSPPTGVAPGLWFLAPSQFGPYGAAGVTPTTATVDGQVTTKSFDGAVSSTSSSIESDNLQQCYLGLTANCGTTIVPAGASASFTVSINPTAPVGSTVSGTLYIMSDSLAYQFGGYLLAAPPFESELAALPYKYTVAS